MAGIHILGLCVYLVPHGTHDPMLERDSESLIDKCGHPWTWWVLYSQCHNIQVMMMDIMSNELILRCTSNFKFY